MNTLTSRRSTRRVIDMNDREYYNYKRAIAFNRNIKKICLRILALSILVIICSFFFKSIASKAESQTSASECKFYTTASLGYNNSLADIAEEYFDEAHYDNVEEFLNEIKSINHITDESVLLGGSMIYVPYYSTVH